MARPITNAVEAAHPLYKTWDAMKQRCYNINDKDYPRYGGRGISICERWQVFNNFWIDMQEGHKEGLTIDRIDNDGDYTPTNCRWATYAENNQNQSTTILTADKVKQIREKYKLKAQWTSNTKWYKETAQEFGSTWYNIKAVIQGQSWRNIQ